MRQKLVLLCVLILILGLPLVFKKSGVVTKVSEPEVNLKTVPTTLVTRVIDGDTFEIEGGQIVRYLGIDAPETVDPNKPVQCFGKESSEENKKLVLGQKVKLVKDISNTDQYGRLLRYVYLNNTFINLKLVQEGFVHATAYPPDVKFQNQFAVAEKIARENNFGLWSSCPH